MEYNQNQIRKVLQRSALCAPLFMLLFGFYMSGCVTFYPPLDTNEISEIFEGHQTPKFLNVTNQQQTLHYAHVGKTNKPLIVFIHGSPGAWNAFSHFMKSPQILEQAQIVSVDRPGYGKSNFGEWETSLLTQVKLIHKTFKHAQENQPIVVAGHSYGGPVAARLAMEYPDEVSGLVMVAPSIDPKLERHQWYQTAAKSWFIRWALPKDLRVANEEIWPLKGELQRQDSLWKNIKCQVLVIQGTKDRLVPAGNAEYARIKLNHLQPPPKILLLEGVDHFIPWTHPELLGESILSMLSNIKL